MCHISTSPPPPHLFSKDLFAPSDGNISAASSGVDLFGLMTLENNNLGSSLDACFSSVVTHPSPSPSPSPLFTSTSSTITTIATISAPIAPSAANPTTDLFSDLFDSMPDKNFTKADPAPSVDLFTAGIPYCTQSAISRVLLLSYPVLPCLFFSALSLALIREGKKRK
ncbi:clathrin coat assembly protein AP180-like isoform X1 [Seriola lalandi dorsalis]|uniref:clathrin coat assembly protein AP180-like isoform X1 n=1 Tax=Seriola lalandi dorsalis TaxID=1841481 RepID=UPI000C6F69D7|nr:clathrin coat assembly protein AP180-like isoform X1 [Seriola lalandi dorsalis]